jgi:hypothetical protein
MNDMDRRSLRFESLQHIVADAEALSAGPVRSAGNWTAAQNVQHVAILIRLSIDGFPARAPWLIRFVLRFMKNRVLARPLKPGFKLPGNFSFLLPDDDVTWKDAVAELRREVDRAASEKMTAPSPILGSMSHEDWTRLHCRHAELHFGFIHPAEA